LAIALSSPVTGGAQTGFTSPTYTVAADAALNAHSKQYAVTAVGGAGNTARVHAADDPFTVAYFRPATYRAQGAANAFGIPTSIPRNVDKIVVRKGVKPHTSLNPQPMVITIAVDRPAGCESNNPVDVRAALSLAIGALNQLSAGIGDTTVSGIL